jgi:hypothetical protein
MLELLKDRALWLGSSGSIFSWVAIDRSLATVAAGLTVIYMGLKVLELKRKMDK